MLEHLKTRRCWELNHQMNHPIHQLKEQPEREMRQLEQRRKELELEQQLWLVQQLEMTSHCSSYHPMVLVLAICCQELQLELGQ